MGTAKTLALTLTLMSGFCVALAQAADEMGSQAPVALTPQDVKWQPCTAVAGAECAEIAGDRTKAELFSYRIRMPGEFIMDPHAHPGSEQVVVISGIFNIGFGDHFDRTKGHAFPAGSFIMIPKGMSHYAWTTGSTVVQVYGNGPWGMIRR